MPTVTRGSITVNTKATMPEGIRVDRFAPVNKGEYVLDYFTCEFYEQVIEADEKGLNQKRACTSVDNEHHWIEQEDNTLNTIKVEVVKGDPQVVKKLLTDAFVASDGSIDWRKVDTKEKS